MFMVSLFLLLKGAHRDTWFRANPGSLNTWDEAITLSGWLYRAGRKHDLSLIFYGNGESKFRKC